MNTIDVRSSSIGLPHDSSSITSAPKGRRWPKPISPRPNDLPQWPTRPAVLLPGTRLAGTRYVVVSYLGQGGMGEVYEVEHTELGTHFAVKVLSPRHHGRMDLEARMIDEARTIARIRHNHLVNVFDLDTTLDGRPYFVMELLQGRDLRAELNMLGVMAVPTALRLAAQALSALAAIHKEGIVHRDIKLENLFLCSSGVVKVLDFGVAKFLDSGLSLTEPEAIIGTPRVMAPEQCRGGKIDGRTDIYAIGLVLYELVAGRGPFDDLRGQRDALRFAHCERPPPPPSALAPQTIPEAVERLILKAIEKAPDQRFQSADEMATAIRRLLQKLDTPPNPTLPTAPCAVFASATVNELRPRHRDPKPSLVVFQKTDDKHARRSRLTRNRASGFARCHCTLQPSFAAARPSIIGLCALAFASLSFGMTLATYLPSWLGKNTTVASAASFPFDTTVR